jgi:hypothetical protein
MTITLTIPGELEERLVQQAQRENVSVEQLTLQVLDRSLPRPERAAEVKALFEQWAAEDAAAGADDDDELFRMLDEDRPSYRKLFPPELKGVTW